jgi:hypothetical protein
MGESQSGNETLEDDGNSRWRRLARRRNVLPVALVLLLVALLAAAALMWRGSRDDDLRIGSRHRIAIAVLEVHPGDCWNNIAPVRLASHGWTTVAHAPEEWGAGEVTGSFEITAAPSGGATATFTADKGGTVDFSGGFAGQPLSGMNCLVGPHA